MQDENVIKGRALGVGLLLLFFALLGFIVVIIGIIDGYWGPITFGLLIALFFLPIGIYSLLPKKIVFDRFEISYWIVNKKKWELLWTDIIKLRTTAYKSSFIVIYTSDKYYRLESGIAFSKNKMIQIFKKLAECSKNYEKIEIQDSLGWKFK
jgi:hypothetical protein